MPLRAAHPAAIAFALLLAATLAAPASAQSTPDTDVIPCDGRYRTRVDVDGFQIDWEEEAPKTDRVQRLIAGERDYDWTGPADASFLLWCRTTEHAFLFAVVARDNAIVGPAGRQKGDRFELWFRFDGDDLPDGRRLSMIEIPVDTAAADGGPVTPVWGHNRPGHNLLNAARAEVVPRERGWFLEVSIPFVALDARPGFAPIGFAAVQRDIDRDGEGEKEVGIATAHVKPGKPESLGSLTFTAVRDRIAAIRKSVSLGGDDLPDLSAWGNVAGDARHELAFFLEDRIFVTGDGLGQVDWTSFHVVNYGTHTPLALTLRDIDHDGFDEVIYRYAVQRRTADGTTEVRQEFHDIYRVTLDQVDRLIHQETARELRDGTRAEMTLGFRREKKYTFVTFTRADGSRFSSETWPTLDPDGEEGYREMPTPSGKQRRLEYGPPRRGDGEPLWTLVGH